jgi:hypothetical protein
VFARRDFESRLEQMSASSVAACLLETCNPAVAVELTFVVE